MLFRPPGLLLALPTALAQRPRPSRGCATRELFKTDGFELEAANRTHVVRLPAPYEAHEFAPNVLGYAPAPAVLYLHGWGGNASEGSAFAARAAAEGVVVASLTGAGPAGWRSWNAAGSTGSPGPMGATCEAAHVEDYCYADCKCADSDGCWWTSCEDSVEVVLAALDALERRVCVDLDRVWVAGCSNGGMAVFEVLADARGAGRFAGGISFVGLPHRGFLKPPAAPAHLLGLWGADDETMPPLANTEDPTVSLDARFGGWYYHTAEAVASFWSEAHGLPAAPKVQSGACLEWRARRQMRAHVAACVFPDLGHVCADDRQVAEALSAIGEFRRLPGRLPRRDDGEDARGPVIFLVVLAIIVPGLLFLGAASAKRRRMTGVEYAGVPAATDDAELECPGEPGDIELT